MGDDVRYQDINTMNEHLPDDLLGDIEQPSGYSGVRNMDTPYARPKETQRRTISSMAVWETRDDVYTRGRG